jgi:hypothetical protein
MKKLKLRLEDLAVRTFAAEDRAGDVHGMQVGYTHIVGMYSCACTAQVGCYPSKYCSGPGCVITYQDGCMTDNQYAC